MTTLQNLYNLYKETISPDVTLHDVHELIEQHTLTYDVLSSVFGDILNLNPISHKLQEITGHDDIPNINIKDRQELIKTTFASLYRERNPKEADRLGIVYTPIEIIRFMIESTDYLLQKHFDKSLADNNLSILDPATGTGSFITELIHYLPQHCLEYKYQHDIFCNEIAILPHYVANLNIEHAYSQETGEYLEYRDLCLMDTLDDDGEDKYDMIIGNPPYRANQKNANDNNPNRKYPAVDKRIKETYIRHSMAQNTYRLYDMYVRFIRWASDRLNDNGILAFVTNRSFIDGRSYDGFRRMVAEEFGDIYIIDLGGNIRKNPKLSGSKHNVFGIQTGVAILLMVKTVCSHISYTHRSEMESASDKLHFLANNKFKRLNFQDIKPDKTYTWIDQIVNEWDTLLPVGTKFVKDSNTIFDLYSLGTNTGRNEWVYDIKLAMVEQKMKSFIACYNQSGLDWMDYSIKWTRLLRKTLVKGIKLSYNVNSILRCSYRPFVGRYVYWDTILNEERYRLPSIFYGANIVITVSDISSPKSFSVLGVDQIYDYDFVRQSQGFPLCRYEEGKRIDNITDYALKQFQEHYNDKTITRLDIFHYVYAVLHNPHYREKYKINLTRELPRIPFYADFKLWLKWG